MIFGWNRLRLLNITRIAAGGTVLAGLIFAAPAVRAQTTYTVTGYLGGASGDQIATDFGYTTNNGVANGTVTISVAQYNPATHGGEALTSVSITLWQETVEQTYSFHNSASTSQTFYETMFAQAGIFAPGPAPNSNGLAASSSTFNIGSPSSQITVAGGGTYTTGSPTTLAGSTGTAGPITGAALASYSGSGNVSFDVTGLGQDTLENAGGNIAATITTDIAAEVIIQYTYQTPEPGSLAFLGAGAAASGLFAFKRRRVKLAPTSVAKMK